MNKPRLSIVINTKNAGETLDRCLNSIQILKADLVVVDMESTDNTVEVAKKYKARIFNHKDLGYADPARNFALKQASGNWILVLDADEEISSSLASFIDETLKNNSETDVFYLPRKNLIFKKWIKHSGWWPDYQARFFKAGHLHWEVGVHKQPTAIGKTKEVAVSEELAIVHHNYITVEDYLERLQRYTSVTALERHSSGDKDNLPLAIEAIRTVNNELLSRLFARDGIKDSNHGVALSYLQSFYELSLKLKLWQLKDFDDKPVAQAKIVKEFEKFKHDLSYWIADWHVKNSTGLTKIFWQLRRSLKA